MKKEDIIKKGTNIYGDIYRYDNCCDTQHYRDKIIVTCKKHGDFSVRPDHFFAGHGCPVCAGKYLNTEYFIQKANEIHKDKYDYSKTEFKSSQEKVCIICPKHGEFWQTPNSHLMGRGCPKCKAEKACERGKSLEDFINESITKHGNKYNYSETEYVNNKTKVKIICPIHGEFWQTPSHHLNGEGCPKCRYESNSIKQMLSFDEFLERAINKHGNKYDYSRVKYNGYENYVEIGCPIHGYFKQTPDSHLHSGGCPKCGATLSKNEDEIIDYIKELVGKDNVIERDRKVLSNGREIDILIPSHNIGIEYNGLYWHSEKNPRIGKFYHLEKTVIAQNKGVSLIHIFEDEYVLHKEIVKHKISHILGKDIDLPKIMGRKCNVKEIEYKEAKKFLDTYHIQGGTRSSVYLGCYYNEKLIGVMSFKKEKNDGNWDLNRFATDYNYRCIGVGGKMFKYFIKNYNPEYVKSFLDRRWCVNEEKNLYTAMGFTKEKILEPDYRYYNEKVNKYERIHKFNFRKKVLSKKYGLSVESTETKMSEQLGYVKIWDCGLIKYVWRR